MCKFPRRWSTHIFFSIKFLPPFCEKSHYADILLACCFLATRHWSGISILEIPASNDIGSGLSFLPEGRSEGATVPATGLDADGEQSPLRPPDQEDAPPLLRWLRTVSSPPPGDSARARLLVSPAVLSRKWMETKNNPLSSDKMSFGVWKLLSR